MTVGEQLLEMRNQLMKIQTELEEILRRIPEPRCNYCGLTLGFHNRETCPDLDHEFVT
jgi:hypothetical protein